MTISSLDNAHVKHWCKLKSKKYRDREGLFLIEGEHLVLEALKNDYVVEVIMENEVVLPLEVPKFYVTKEILKKLTSLESPPNIIAVARRLKEQKYQDHILMLDGIQDPGNLGTLIRTAVAFNIDTIILNENTVDLYNEKVLRATQGLIFHINIIRKNLIEMTKELKNNKYRILGTNVTHGQRISDIFIPSKYAFILGNEGNGISPELLQLCDDYIYLEMNDVCESLNVAIAGSIILYELNKNKRSGENEKEY